MTQKGDDGYDLHRDKMRERQRKARAQASEVGPIPKIANAERRDCSKDSLRYFCEAYRGEAFSLGWSTDHLKVIDRIQSTVRDGGLFALAMPRGSGKTTITVTAALWALLHGFRRWVCLVGATSAKAESLLKAIKMQLRFNQELAADFPEACWPIQCLEGRATRATAQTLNDEPTNIAWLREQLILPTVPGSPSSGSAVTVAGITGDIRGQQMTLADGSVIRPDYVLLDDPQTRESARSPQQTEDRVATLHGDILGLAGPGVKISGVMPCTVISRGDMADQMLDRQANPEWHGERTQMLYGMPKHMNLWGQYQEIREQDFRNGGDGQAATQFYLENREAMDAGAVPAWPERFNQDEISATQHAMNLLFRDEGAFHAEYQNQPLEASEDYALNEEEISQRINDLRRGVVDDRAETLTAMIDVQKEMLFYTVIAWRKDFSGWIVDYGGFPDQKTTNFRYAQAKRTFSKLWPQHSLEVKLRKALTELVNNLCSRSWERMDGSEVSIERMLIDANWGNSRDIVYDFCRTSAHRNIVRPSHGKYVGASSQPLNAATVKKAGKTIGTHWRMDKARDSRIRHVLYDTNFWKSFFMSRLSSEPGTPGSLTLWKASPKTHMTFASHCTAEKAIRTEGRGREVDEWRMKPDRRDNHWFDCAVGCCVAASMMGCVIGRNMRDLVNQKEDDSDQSKPTKRRRTKKRGVTYL